MHKKGITGDSSGAWDIPPFVVVYHKLGLEKLLSTKSVTFGRHIFFYARLNKYYFPNVEVIYDSVAIAKM